MENQTEAETLSPCHQVPSNIINMIILTEKSTFLPQKHKKHFSEKNRKKCHEYEKSTKSTCAF